jgi:hypothetical protein
MRPVSRRHLAATALVAIVALVLSMAATAQATPRKTSDHTLFAAASQRTGVPASLLEAICYVEGRLSMHGGHPSLDHGYGCMHLTANQHAHTLREAARDIGVDAHRLKTDLGANVLGGAAVLRDQARKLSGNGHLPTSLGGWYGAVAAYSGAVVKQTALMYADAVFATMRHGFTGRTDDGQQLTLAPRRVQPTKASARGVHTEASALPQGCQRDTKVDYSPAIDCIVPPKIFDCKISPYDYPGCTYVGANRPSSSDIDGVVIHDIEGTAQDGLNVFQDHNSGVSIHYVVDTDGTVYQLLHEHDIAYQDGNFNSNVHTIGIEHAGFDANGYEWYNATEYLASAQLVAYLLTKYHLPLDRGAIVAHGTVPSPNYLSVNHVDPGPYWLWDYYLSLIHNQGVPYSPTSSDPHLFTIRNDQQPQADGSETADDFGFYYLYSGPSTASAPIPSLDSGGNDITDESDNVEADMSYYSIGAPVPDPAGSGDTMYQIWYGEYDQLQSSPSSQFQDAQLAWVAVPPTSHVAPGVGTAVTIAPADGSSSTFVYGDPDTSTSHILGGAPAGATFASMTTVGNPDHPKKLFYEIDFNHRQAWVPATDVTVAGG